MKIKRKSKEKQLYKDIRYGQVVELRNNEIVMKIPNCEVGKECCDAVSLSGGNDTLVKTLCYVGYDEEVTILDCELHIL